MNIQKSIKKLINQYQSASNLKPGIFFNDIYFLPNDKSIFSENPIYSENNKEKYQSFLSSEFSKSQYTSLPKNEKYSWRSISQYIKDYHIIKNISLPLSNEDIIQGNIGNCYFFSALKFLAEESERIISLFDIEENKNLKKNYFEIYCYINGYKCRLIIDDKFPYMQNSEDEFSFFRYNKKTKNIWPMILEKVWAKCNKSYEDIIPGNSADAIQFLTPAPYDTYYHTQEISATLFKTIQDASNNNYIILADITETKNTNLDTLSKMGLITNHAYSVIGTAVLKKPNGNEIQLLKMKNIWGTNEWIGDWSDQSLKWTQEFKKAVGLQNKEDGVFWMSYDDYLQFYTTTHIAQVHSDYTYKVVKMKNKEAQNICKITTDKNGSGYFMVNLKNSRIYKNLKNPNYTNPFCSITVMKLKDGILEFIGSDSGKKDRFYISCPEMEKATYYVAVSFPKMNKSAPLQDHFEFNQSEFSFRVGVYSTNKDVKFSEVEDSNEIGDFLFDSIADNAEKNEEKYYFAQEGEPTSYRVIYFNNDKKGFGYIYYKNNSDAYIKERMEITSLQNINIIPLLNNGYFMSRKDEEVKEEEKEEIKPKTKQNTVKGKTKKKYNDEDEDTNEKVNEKIDYESKNVSITINALKGTTLDSYAEIIEEGKIVIVQFNIAPHSSNAILLQKTADESDIDLNSDICFDYLPNVLLGEQKFSQKKYRKYICQKKFKY